MTSDFIIHEVRTDEHAALGGLLVAAYAALPGMPTVDEQPE